MRRGSRVEITTDASPWGIGANLAIVGVIVEYIVDAISDFDQDMLGNARGTSDGQQAWEALAILVALRRWREKWQVLRVRLAVRNDNIGALSAVARLKAHSPALSLCARELALDLADGTFSLDLAEQELRIAN
eukprot:7812916-Heterocapsa_arctica.AAC.1